MKVLKAYKFTNNKMTEQSPLEFEKAEYESFTLNVYDEEISVIEGFGGAFTDSSAYNYKIASEKSKKEILELLFGESGLKYNFCRLCIGSSDFAKDEYCYVKDNDYSLETFNIERDKEYVIPFVLDVMKYSKNEIKIFASPWSPPAFMKTNNSRVGGGKLKKDCYELYSEYITKFLQAYSDEGIKIYALTLQNEAKAVQTWESCTFTADEEIAFAKVLKKTLVKHGLDDVKLFCWDHNKERVFEKADDIFGQADDVIDGIAYHWYSGEHFDGVRLVKRKYPNKFLFASEFCYGMKSYRFGVSILKEILNDINSGSNAVCEWNLVLDENGGPFHNRQGGCFAPVHYNAELDRVRTVDSYYERYVFSHFVKRNAVSLYTSTYSDDVQISAFKNPDGEIIVVVNNMGESCNDTRIYYNKRYYYLPIEEKTQYVLVIDK